MLAEPRIIQSGNNYIVQHGDDRGLYVEFSMEQIKNEQRSAEEGRPIFEDKEYITIRIVGDSKTVRKRPVQLEWSGNQPPDPDRWPRQYEAFKRQDKIAIEGTPLEHWPMITRSDVASLKSLNIYSVEQLAELPENAMNWVGARKYKEMAQTYLKATADTSGISKLHEENSRLRRDLEAMQNQINALSEIKKTRKKVANVEDAT